jgi:hypothetical protein
LRELNAGVDGVENNDQLPRATKWQLLTETQSQFRAKSLEPLLRIVSLLKTRVREAKRRGMLGTDQIMPPINGMIDDLRRQIRAVGQHLSALETDLKGENQLPSVESVPTIETLIQLAKRVPRSGSSDPLDYVIVEYHCEQCGIKDANPWEFRELLSQAVDIPMDSIISVEFCVGSLVAKALCSFDVNFTRVKKF